MTNINIAKVVKIVKDFSCEKCNYKCSNQYDYNKHLATLKHERLINGLAKIAKTYLCACGSSYKHPPSLSKHKKTCQTLIQNETTNKMIQLLQQNNELLLQTQELKEVINPTSNTITNYPVNNQLINIIVDKINTISELKNIINEKEISCEAIPVVLSNKELPTLNINNVIIVSRSEDNYINATQLCQEGNRQFSQWYRLDSTKLLINALKLKVGIPTLEKSDMGIHTSQLIDIKKGNSNDFNQGSWIHPDLAIQLAQWISPIFALQVSEWIRTLFTNGSVSINIKLLEDKQKEIDLKDHKIKLLEDAYVKKQQRKDYPEKNVIYILTTEDNKKKRIYIIGKAIDLKNRLSTYNKTSEHEVVYYKECKSEEDMNIIECMVLNKLKDYKEKANRDRFILPVEKEIIFFTNVLDLCIDFF
jgi:hypothetical protein